jgi:hypothetical protein
MEPDRPTLREIEVTPAMIEAGVDVFRGLPELLGPTEGQLRAAVRDCFVAMTRRARKRRSLIRLPSF